MRRDFRQVEWDDDAEEDCRALVRLAVREDLERGYDWTTVLLVPDGAVGAARLVARQSGVVAGLRAAALALAEFEPLAAWQPRIDDGAAVSAGQCLASVRGPARGLLTAERTMLNLLGRLSGVATLTRQFVQAIEGTKARVYDTRKTMPGWRRLEKLAVRAGGGHNHRLGLYDAVLIKDNHLAWGAGAVGDARFSPAAAVNKVRRFLDGLPTEDPRRTMLVEVEVDTLDQLDEVLPTGPDVVLLDNMHRDNLRLAVARRDAAAPRVELEASGGVSIVSIGRIAQTGVDRISVGALTHSAVCLDIGLDWDQHAD
jgi:nicotinate-nucleotide pyrophosphorylase (carboxylating)